VLSNLLAGVNFNSVQSTVVKAAEAMDWMQQAARMVAKEGRPVCWTTPLGLPVVQNYLQTKEARVETSLAGVRKVLSIREETLKPDTRKAANSISPNVVHSLDASHLMLTVANAHAEGLRSFALIHDSFGVHVADSPRFFGIIRESFVELYEGNVFADLAEQFKAQVHPDKHEEFPELPSMGRLDPQVTLDSLYSFA
jgi:DNA-directed RNA polymerase